jgi:tryptophan synthase alpha chain
MKTRVGNPCHDRTIADHMNSSLADSIRSARDAAGVALMPFVAAGYPSIDASIAILKSLDLPGIGAIEVGIPFSDPTADGPVIQEAFVAALDGHFKVAAFFAALAKARGEITTPMVAMVSYSIVFRYGVERFFADAKNAGFAGILCPDLPPPEADSVCAKARSAGLDTVLLVAPTTSPSRREEIAQLCTGFVYYLSVAGITGERDKLPADLEANVCQLKSISASPVCIGFGISQRKHIEQLVGVGDGAIVGTALVRVVREHASEAPAQIAQAVRKYCETLLGT